MGQNAAGALALVLLWLAFACFFVAFHPGGLRSDSLVTDNNPDGQAQNPRDVILWFMERITKGTPASGQTGII